MSRMIKWAAPLAAIALLLSLSTATTRAEDKKETGKISGSVVDKDGKPAVGAEVMVFHPMGKAKASKSEGQAEKGDKPAKEKPVSVVPAVKTDDKGEFTFNDVPVGDYTVVAKLRGSGNGRENVSVKAGETAKVEIKLKSSSKAPVSGEKAASDKQEK